MDTHARAKLITACRHHNGKNSKRLHRGVSSNVEQAYSLKRALIDATLNHPLPEISGMQ